MQHEVVGKLKAWLAAWRHGSPARNMKIIAVAGNRGKTTTALYLGELLRESGSSVFTMTSLGCQRNGIPSLQGYDSSVDGFYQCIVQAKKDGVDYLIIEVSDALAELHILPTLHMAMSIVTNDSTSAQALLREAVDYTVVPSGFGVNDLSVSPHQAISFGEDAAAEAQIVSVKEMRGGTEIELVIDHQTKLTASTYLVGKANALNVAAAISAAYVLAANMSTFEEGIARLEAVPGNYEYLHGKDQQYSIVVDRANTPDSLWLVLETARKLKKRRLLVLADETVSSDEHLEIKRLSDRLVVVSGGSLIPGVEQTADVTAALEVLRRGAKRDDLLLLLGRNVGKLLPDGTTAVRHDIEAPSE